ncbi:MAG: DNA-directed RNA polymerase subunit A', partial [Candidatus Aenigmarchaeota archaeon]|nr:DNA-directed RNA polymerase subunit A' [Candidatus Aenigmarchaeota archaeon]
MADISEIKFHMVSPEHIKKIATIEIANSEVYDADAYPIEGGVMDPHLGVIDPGMRCKTCGSKSGECLGHFGYINLSKPVYNILFIKKIKEVLVLTCQECSKLLFDKENVKNRTYDLNKIKPATKCPNCGYNNKKIKFERPQSFTCDGDRITPEQIREQFEKISDEDLSILKMNGGRPEWMILTILPVPPITTRPSITLEDGERSEDDLTHKLVDVIRINQRLANNLEIG